MIGIVEVAMSCPCIVSTQLRGIAGFTVAGQSVEELAEDNGGVV
jgi:hypothetical protein